MSAATTLTLSIDPATVSPGGTITATVAPDAPFAGMATLTPSRPGTPHLAPVTLEFDGTAGPQSARFTSFVTDAWSISLSTTTEGLAVAGSPAAVAVIGSAAGPDVAGTSPRFSTFANLTAAGDGVVADAVAGKRLAILGYSLTADAPVVITFKSPSVGPISSGKHLVAGGAVVVPCDGGPHFATAPGDPLVLNLSANANVGVEVRYAVLG
jgi:hypothetical protein